MTLRAIRAALLIAATVSATTPSLADIARASRVDYRSAGISPSINDSREFYLRRGLAPGASGLGIQTEEVRFQGLVFVWMRVLYVAPGSSFSGAIRTGDLIVGVNGFQFRSLHDYLEFVTNLPPGTPVAIRVRNEKTPTFYDVVGQARSAQAFAAPGAPPPATAPQRTDKGWTTTDTVIAGGLALGAACMLGIICSSGKTAEPRPTAMDEYKRRGCDPASWQANRFCGPPPTE